MPHEPGSPSRWLDYARGDLVLAQRSADCDVPLLLLCFHAQQAVEKSVKAVLLSREIEHPWTHNLSILFELLPPDVPRPGELEAVLGLTVYAVAGRYPAEIDEASHAEHTEAVRLATVAVAWAERELER
ncbi:MAG: HEPN domain-containing protein [Actinobacteria bacterium]|nr:HEPN domain-containing protein [Actinomycetota bacterium]